MLDLVEGECSSPHRTCFLKEYVLKTHPEPRLLIQLKCIEMLKICVSKREERKVSWQEAATMWVEEGYAKKLADLYQEGCKVQTLYNKIMED